MAGWLDQENLRKQYACLGFLILKTKAASAIPELVAMIKGAKISDDSFPALAALIWIGPPASPALKAMLTDPNQPERHHIIDAFRWVDLPHGTNFHMPILMESLNDPDFKVRSAATNAIETLTGQALNNAPVN